MKLEKLDKNFPIILAVRGSLITAQDRRFSGTDFKIFPKIKKNLKNFLVSFFILFDRKVDILESDGLL